MKAFIVMGPESTGTRLLTRVLISAGCAGDGGHEQRFDERIPPPEEVGRDIVWRRSIPHFESEKMPSLDRMERKLAGYETKVLLTSRSFYPTAKSQMTHRDHIEDIQQAYERIRNGYAHAFDQVKDRDFMIVTYEGMERSCNSICNHLDLGEPNIDIYDGNEKYFS